MASLATSFAIANPKIVATIIEADEYQDLAQRYAVYGVPRTIINEVEAIEGAVPQDVFLESVLKVSNAAESSTA